MQNAVVETVSLFFSCSLIPRRLADIHFGRIVMQEQ